MNKELQEDFNEQSDYWKRLKECLSYAFGIPEKSIKYYRTASPWDFPKEKIYVVHVATKALVTVLVKGIEKDDIEEHQGVVIDVLSASSKCNESDIQISLFRAKSCKLVVLLPGLAMLRLMIAFFSQQTSSLFLQKLARVLPESAYEVSFGFASLPDYPAKLPKLHAMPKLGDKTRQFIGHRQKGNIDSFLNYKN